jgi:hypothetical protein
LKSWPSIWSPKRDTRAFKKVDIQKLRGKFILWIIAANVAIGSILVGVNALPQQPDAGHVSSTGKP